jgi:HYR domain-containing protein
MSRIAKWDGSSWTSVGGGMSPDGQTSVWALAVHDDGSGPALYAGGGFPSAGGVPASNIARWDGTSWSALGSGLNGGVASLVVHDDGNGPALYAGGFFTIAGGVAANSIAKWDGSSWSAIGGGFVDGTVSALAVYDDGSGPALFAGGQFDGVAGGKHIARWNGSTWAAVGGGLPDTEDRVHALAVFDDGFGPELFVGGDFRGAGSLQVYGIARWDGSSWAPVGTQDDAGVDALVVHDDGTGPALYAGGGIEGVAGSIARWDGLGWTSLGFGNEGVRALAVHDDGGGPALYAGGIFKHAGSVAASRIAKRNGPAWSALGGRATAMSCEVGALAAYDDGSGPALHAAIDFRSGDAARRIVRWDGSSWAPLGGGVGGVPLVPEVHALAVHDDGSGPALYAGGRDVDLGTATTGIARWNGSSWTALGTGMNGGSTVHDLAVHDDGGGPALYAGGSFTTAGGIAAKKVARWNGSSWSALGAGISGGGGGNPTVFALASYDDGSGPALYAGGNFTIAGGNAASRIARWNGASWSALGSGLGPLSVCLGLTVYDDGSGPALIVCGTFTTAGGVFANNIAKWDGTSWSSLGFGTNDSVLCLTVHDDGCGPALFAAGEFTLAGIMAANRIARWNGSFWAPLGSGVSGAYPWVHALTVFDGGNGPALVAGGFFSSAPDSGDSYVAEWGFDTTPPVLSCPSSIAVPDGYGDGPGEVVSFTVTATDNLDPSPVVVCVPPSGSTFPPGTTLVVCTATDASGNASTCQFPVSVQPKARRR